MTIPPTVYLLSYQCRLEGHDTEGVLEHVVPYATLEGAKAAASWNLDESDENNQPLDISWTPLSDTRWCAYAADHDLLIRAFPLTDDR